MSNILFILFCLAFAAFMLFILYCDGVVYEKGNK